MTNNDSEHEKDSDSRGCSGDTSGGNVGLLDRDTASLRADGDDIDIDISIHT